jgi:arylsulfatase A-like enzyme
MLAPPVSAILRAPILRTIAIAAVGTGALVALSLVLYPAVEDFRGEVFDSYAWLSVLLGTLLLVALLPPRSAVPATVALFLAGVAVLSLRGQGEPTVRLIAHEHSRIGSLAGNSFPARWLDPFPVIGMAPVPGSAFVHHGPGEDRLPPSLPGLDRPFMAIVIWDAARPDHLSAYGYHRRTTPNLERLAARSVRCERTYAAATATSASVRKLLCGRYATRFMLSTRHPPFLLEELAAAGYDRFVITVTGNDFNGVSGEAFERGWESDREGLRFLRIDAPNEDRSKPDRWKTEQAIERLREIREERGSLAGTFAYVHLTGTHIPWLNEDPAADFGDRPVDLYDGEIAKADRLLGLLMGALEDMGEAASAVLVVTADHGTGLLEHGRIAGFLPYEEQTRVPLVVRVPGVAPRVVTETVGLIDVAPTLVGLVQPGMKHRFHGRSFLPLMTGERERLSPRPLVSFNSFRDSYALLDETSRWKLVHDRRRRYEGLFDLETDPGETRNRIADAPIVADRLRTLLSAFLWQGRKSYGNPYHYRDWTGPR